MGCKRHHGDEHERQRVGSLRQAILDAASGDAINFNIPTDDPGCTGGVCTITLASELTIDKSLTIQGRAANQLTVSGNNAVRVFNIASGNFDVTLSGLTIANGTSGFSHGDRDGGGISNNSTGTLNVTNSTLSGNTADAGGGNANGTGTVNVTNSTLSGNHAGFDGGGIANGTGTVNVTNS